MGTNRKKAILFTILVLILALAVVGATVPGSKQGGRPLTATLTGAAEVSGPGDTDGSGRALITLNVG